MKITRIEAIPFRIPLREVIKFSTGQLDAAEHVLVRIHTDTGLIGTAEAPERPMVYGESLQSIVTAIGKWFAPALAGLDPFAIEQIWARLQRVEQNPTAKGAIDMALHDLMGQAAGVPCHRLMGGWAREIALSHILGLGAPEKVAEDARKMTAAYGIRTFKLKAGLDPVRDTAMIEGVRKALGPDVRLHVDCNHGYSSLVALRVIPRWEPFDIAWVEEPCPGWDTRGRALVRQATSIPIMADESCTTPAEVAAELDRGECRLMSIKTARTGFHQSARIVHLCEEAGVATVIGSQGDSDLGAIASAHFACAHRATSQFPAELTYFLEITDGLLVEPPVIHDGKLALSDRPGLGLVIDEARLARYRIDL